MATGSTAGTGTVREFNPITTDSQLLTLAKALAMIEANVYTLNPNLVVIDPLNPTVPVARTLVVRPQQISNSPIVVAWDVPVESLTKRITVFDPSFGGSTLIDFNITAAFAVPTVSDGGAFLMRLTYTFP